MSAIFVFYRVHFLLAGPSLVQPISIVNKSFKLLCVSIS